MSAAELAPEPDQRIHDPELARVMADAEAPYRDRIAERKKDVAMAKDAADATVNPYVYGTGNVGPADPERMQLQHTMLHDVTERVNNRDLKRAEEASEAVRRQQG